ncbi:Major facilitator superfamily domain, general substrate transporter [Cordyceps fumosorosea ARSEF 2679]|uniref:Major facilitator superfamily domain, general substrate transporter n=1 Tax=Cordyceps fumosorosea (strain ARSEF 2679) TaxID=1081104 RepID=A0A168E4D3_CORFA|nr:Major facilitator superfamily domain, general substrate transporter [Cordyceps fumosorosea ARSEF 2679]OAA73361.1 Major facilitator superfamily domain, general substrate transporter [Cordyceps fumosorosea ARSEF 2679]
MSHTEKAAETAASTSPMDNNNDSARVSSQQDSSDSEKAAASAPASSPPPPPPPPDGGVTAWLVVLGGWCTAFCSFGWLNSIGVFQQYYQKELLRGQNASTVSWIPSLQIFFILGLGPIVGMIFDRYGPRGLLLVGTLMHVFGIMMASISTKYWQILLAQGVCSGIGVSAVFQPPLSCVAGYFNKKRGAAFGILSTGASVGGVVWPIMVTHLIRRVGFGWAMRTSALVNLALLAIPNVTVRCFQPPVPKKVTGAQLARPFREVDYLLVAAGFLFLTYGVFVPLNYLPVQAASTGTVEPGLVQYLLPILNGASLFGRLFAGFMGDKIGRFNILVGCCYLSGVWILALWITSSTQSALIAFAALFGFSSGAYISLVTPVVAQISPLPEIGFRTGIVFFVASIGGLTTNPVSGALIDSSGGYTGMKIFAGVLCLVGTTFILVERVRKTGPRLVVAF